ncbi:MAG: glycosyltransferase [Desulfarculus sp.]|jgi:glycosyltransferase involved in cell wall biosynthesis|nr:MAG: glycosyltransferase [Desulfarculus sp.]
MSQPRKVLHVITTTTVGGAEVQLARLIAASDPRRFQHLVVGLTPEGLLAGEMRRAGAQVLSLDLEPSLHKGVAGLLRLVAIMRNQRPDLVQGWMYHANLMALLASRLAGVRPVIWGLRCSDMNLGLYRQGTRLLVKVCALLSRWPTAIVSNSQRGVDFHLRQGYPAQTMRVIYNGFRVPAGGDGKRLAQAPRRRLGMAKDDLLVGHMARFDPMKDHATFLEAATQVARRLRNVHFVLLGLDMTESNPALERVLNLPLAGRCHLLGRQENVTPWLAAMDLHVSSSAFGEGLSNAVGESMAAGIPNVVTQVGDNVLLVGDTGRSVPPRRPAELAQAMEDILTLPREQRLALGQRARARIQEKFSQQTMARAFDQLYEELLTSQAAGSLLRPAFWPQPGGNS